MKNKKEIAKGMLPEFANESVKLVSQLYKDLAQPTIQTIGKTLNTTFEFATIPALALGMATEKVKANFTKRIEEYKKKLDEIPETDRCMVEPEIGTPIISSLMNTTNDQIADLFTTLLTNASNIKTLDKAHPKFAQIVQNLTPDEARIISYLKDKREVCYLEFQGHKEKEEGYFTIMSYVTLIPYEVKLSYPENINAYISNLVSLGVLLDMTGTYLVDDSIYSKIEEFHRPALEKQWIPSVYNRISTKKSYFQVTDFGRLFINACIL